MDFVLDNKISLDSLLTIVLAIVFIFQTAYLVRQTNYSIRSNQANLTETWSKEFKIINIDLLLPKTPNTPPDENEFRKLVVLFDRMHHLFRSKLLKPSDFAYTFITLYKVTRDDTIRKTKFYRDNYLKLQNIFHDFNKDWDMIYYIINIQPTSAFENMLKTLPIAKSNADFRNKVIDNFTKAQSSSKYAVALLNKLRNKPLLPLKRPID